MIWQRVTNPAVEADYLIEGAVVDPHEIPRLRCPRCAEFLAEWPGDAVYGDEDGSAVLFWEQTHECGARLRVLAPADHDL